MHAAFVKSLPVCSAVVALILTGGEIGAQSADDLIRNGDVFYSKLETAEALKCYLSAEKLDPKNVRLLVHISREYRHLMSDATKAEEKRRLGGMAVEYAKRAVSFGPNDPEANLAMAISYGKLQPLEGNWERIQASRIIKSAADKVVSLDPHNDLGWHILGRWHEELAEVSAVKRGLAQAVYGETLPESTHEEAAKCLKKAIELNPHRLIHYISLGGVYAQMGRTEDALHLINKGLAMQETEKDDPEAKRQGRELLAKLR